MTNVVVQPPFLTFKPASNQHHDNMKNVMVPQSQHLDNLKTSSSLQASKEKINSSSPNMSSSYIENCEEFYAQATLNPALSTDLILLQMEYYEL
jgi:hypothetical protein